MIFRRIVNIIITAILLAIATAGEAPAAPTSPFARSVSSYLLQVNGETYEEKAPNQKCAPASLTKIMTALIVIETCRMDDVVTVSRTAAAETGSRIALRRGEKYRVHDLLAATLLASANDAARALAGHAAGSQKAFVTLMNRRAKALALSGTRFTNVCGHDDLGHYSTARDLAVITERALRHPVFTDLVAKREMRITTLNGKRTVRLLNKNRLIGRYAGALGVKTGTTRGAGQCLVALAQRGDTRVLLVLMHSQNRWRAAPAMLDQVFASNLGVKEPPIELPKTGGSNEAPPEGAVVPDKDKAQLPEHNTAGPTVPDGERN